MASQASESSTFHRRWPLDARVLDGSGALFPIVVQRPGDDVAKSGFLRACHVACCRFTKNYALACFDFASGNPKDSGHAMTLSVADITEDASPMRGLLPLWVGVGVYALFLLAGNRLLIDPDTMWQITVGQWILDHRAVPKPTSIPSPCAASPGSRRSGWRRCSTPRPMRSRAGAGRWCWRPARSRRRSRCWQDS